VPRRAQLIPWKVAGQVTDRQTSADDVVQATGWVFNNETRGELTLADFVRTGDAEVPIYLDGFGLSSGADEQRTLVEIGSGIGRMTCGFTRRFGTVYACDLDAGFLERCREAVARFGLVDRLRTVPVPDGRTLDIPTGVADVVFSYITLQHCDRHDALALVDESIRVTRPGGTIALNFRARTWTDMLLLPLGFLARGAFAIPGVGGRLSRRRLATRLAWQANRLDPHHVLQPIADRVGDVSIWRNQTRAAPLWGIGDAELRFHPSIGPSHWWLVATIP
jgi:SAM-dependent methyltransferase